MNAKEVRIEYCLVKANPTHEVVDGMEPLTGYYCMRTQFPPNSPWTQATVELSNKLASRLRRGTTPHLLPGQEYVGTTYCSDNMSQEIHENPFRLKHFVPTGNSDIPEHYRLELVNEAISKKEEMMHPLGVKLDRWKFESRSKGEWLRYELVKNVKKLADCSENLRIVNPNLMSEQR